MIQNQFKYNLCEWSCGSRDDLSQTLSQCLKIMVKGKTLVLRTPLRTTLYTMLCSSYRKIELPAVGDCSRRLITITIKLLAHFLWLLFSIFIFILTIFWPFSQIVSQDIKEEERTLLQLLSRYFRFEEHFSRWFQV